MNSKLFGVLAIMSLLTTACSSQPEVYTSDYLYANDEVRSQVLADCKENNQTPENCQAANEAEQKKSMEETRNRLLGSD